MHQIILLAIKNPLKQSLNDLQKSFGSPQECETVTQKHMLGSKEKEKNDCAISSPLLPLPLHPILLLPL